MERTVEDDIFDAGFWAGYMNECLFNEVPAHLTPEQAKLWQEGYRNGECEYVENEIAQNSYFQRCYP